MSYTHPLEIHRSAERLPEGEKRYMLAYFVPPKDWGMALAPSWGPVLWDGKHFVGYEAGTEFPCGIIQFWAELPPHPGAMEGKA